MGANTNLRPVPRSDESERERAIRRMADVIHQMNQAIGKAVELGVTVELVRCSRYHDERGHWGDQMIPLVRTAEDEKNRPDPA